MNSVLRSECQIVSDMFRCTGIHKNKEKKKNTQGGREKIGDIKLLSTHCIFVSQHTYPPRPHPWATKSRLYSSSPIAFATPPLSWGGGLGAMVHTCEVIRSPPSHLDLGLAPYVLYGVKYIDLVSLSLQHEASAPPRTHTCVDPSVASCCMESAPRKCSAASLYDLRFMQLIPRLYLQPIYILNI